MSPKNLHSNSEKANVAVPRAVKSIRFGHECVSLYFRMRNQLWCISLLN